MRAQNGKSNFVVVQVAIVESYQYPATAGFFLDRTVDKCQSFFKSYQRVIALQVGNLFVELVESASWSPMRWYVKTISESRAGSCESKGRAPLQAKPRAINSRSPPKLQLPVMIEKL